MKDCEFVIRMKDFILYDNHVWVAGQKILQLAQYCDPGKDLKIVNCVNGYRNQEKGGFL